MTIISFQEAIRAYKDGDYQVVTDFIDQGNPLLQFNGDDLIEVELIYLVSSSVSLNNSIKDLISKGIDLDETTNDQDQYSAVHFAAWDNKWDILEYLIKSGADPNIKGTDGLSPLYLACVNGNYKSVKCLVDNGAELNHLYNGVGIEGLSDYFSKEGGTVLRGALINIELEIAQYLINSGADVMELIKPCKGFILDKNFLPTYDFFELVNHNYFKNKNLQSLESEEKFSEILNRIKNMTQG